VVSTVTRRSLVIYVAGPFRGRDAWQISMNIFLAAKAALDVWRAGFTCLCPHLNTAPYQGALNDETWLEGDMVLITRCDALLLMSHWELSQGARSEKVFAEDQGIPVFFNLPALEAWADARRRA